MPAFNPYGPSLALQGQASPGYNNPAAYQDINQQGQANNFAQRQSMLDSSSRFGSAQAQQRLGQRQINMGTANNIMQAQGGLQQEGALQGMQDKRTMQQQQFGLNMMNAQNAQQQQLQANQFAQQNLMGFRQQQNQQAGMPYSTLMGGISGMQAAQTNAAQANNENSQANLTNAKNYAQYGGGY